MEEELEFIVKGMVEANESEENIALVIKNYKPKGLKKKDNSDLQNTELPTQEESTTTSLGSEEPRKLDFSKEKISIPDSKDKYSDLYKDILPSGNSDFTEQKKAELISEYKSITSLDDSKHQEIQQSISNDDQDIGLWNTIKQGAKDYWNNVFDVELALQVETDALKESRNKAVKELKKNNIETTPENLKKETYKIELEKRKGKVIDERVEDWIEGLEENNKWDVKAFFKKEKNIELDKKYKKSISYSLQMDDIIKEQPILEDSLRQLQEKFDNSSGEISDEDVRLFKSTQKSLFENAVKYDKTLKEFNEVQDELQPLANEVDLFKRNYNDWENFTGRVVNGFGNIGLNLAYLTNEIAQLNSLNPATASMPLALSLKIENDIINAKNNLAERSDLLKRNISVNDIDSPNDAIEWMLNTTAEQIPVVTTLASTGGAGLTLLSASSAGQKAFEIDQEDKEKEEQTSLLKKWGSIGVSFGATYLSEKVTLGQLNKTKRVLNAMPFNELKKSATQFAKNNYKEYFVDVASEVGSEVFEAIGNNLADNLRGKNVSIFKDVNADLVLSAVFMSNAFKSPLMFRNVAKAITTKDYNQKLGENNAKILEYNKSLQNSKLNDSEKKVIQDKVDNLLDNNNKMIQKSMDKVAELDSAKKKRLLSIEQEVFNNRKDYESIKEGNYDSRMKSELLKDVEVKVNDLLDEKDSIINSKEKQVEPKKDEGKKKGDTVVDGEVQPSIEVNESKREVENIQSPVNDKSSKETLEKVKKDVSDKINPDTKINEKNMGRFYDLLDEWDKNLSDYGKENLSFGLPIALAQGAVKTMKLAVKTAKTGADIIKAGADYIRNSDWYKSQTKESKENIDKTLADKNNFFNAMSGVVDEVKSVEKKKFDKKIENLKHKTIELRKKHSDLVDYKKDVIDSIYKSLRLKTINNLSNYFNKSVFYKINKAKTFKAVDKIIEEITLRIENQESKVLDKDINKLLIKSKFVKSVDGKPKAISIDNETRKIFKNIKKYTTLDSDNLQKKEAELESNLNTVSEKEYESVIDDLVAIKTALDLKISDELISQSKEDKKDVSGNIDLLYNSNSLKRGVLNNLTAFRAEGRYRLKELVKKEADRLKTIQESVLKDTKHKYSDLSSSTISKKKEARNYFSKKINSVLSDFNMVFNRPVLSSFEFFSKTISNNPVLEDSFLYKYFYKNKTGFVEAGLKKREELKGDEKKLKDFVSKQFNLKNKSLTFLNFIGKSRKVVSNSGIFLKDNKDRLEERPMSKFNALAIYQWSKMGGMKNNLEEAGYLETSIEQVKKFLGKDYIALGDYMTKFLESKFDDYNKKYVEIMRTEVNKIENYFPVQYNKENLNNEVDLDNEYINLLASVTPKHTIKRVSNNNALADDADAFSLFSDYLETMTHFKNYARATKDINSILSNKQFKHDLETRSEDGKVYKQFKEAAANVIGVKAPMTNTSVSKLGKLSYRLTKSIAVTYVGLKSWTASKQILSFFAVLEYSKSVRVSLGDKSYRVLGLGTSKFLSKLAINANPFSIYNSHKFLFKNSRIYNKRISDGDVGSEVISRVLKDRKTYSKLGYLKLQAAKINLAQNKFVDALTISWTGKVLYNQQKNTYKKNGYSDKKAHELAIRDFEIYMETSQQSSSVETLSENQRDKSWAGTFTAFKNSQQGYYRKEVSSIIGLVNSYKYEKDRLLKSGDKKAGVKSLLKILKKEKDQNKIKTFLLYGYIMPVAWQYVASGLPGILTAWDEDDEYEMKRSLVLGTFDGIFILKDLLSFGADRLQGKNWRYQPSILIQEFNNLGNDLAKIDSDMSFDMAYLATKYTLKYTGMFDLDVSVNIYKALEKMFKDGEVSEDQIKNLMNAPKAIKNSNKQPKESSISYE